MTTNRPSGWRAFTGASAFAIPVAVSAFGATLFPLGWLAMLALLPAGIAATIDIYSLRLPDQLVTISGCIALAAALAVGRPASLLGAGVAGGSVLVLHLADPDWFGYGDVKLAGALGAVIGLVDWKLSMWVLAGAALLGLLTAAGTRRAAIPFGPALVVAAACSLLVDIVTGGSWS